MPYQIRNVLEHMLTETPNVDWVLAAGPPTATDPSRIQRQAPQIRLQQRVCIWHLKREVLGCGPVRYIQLPTGRNINLFTAGMRLSIILSECAQDRTSSRRTSEEYRSKRLLPLHADIQYVPTHCIS